jgi:hypothetical protein
MKIFLCKKIITPFASIFGGALVTPKTTGATTRDYALRGRFYYLSEW